MVNVHLGPAWFFGVDASLEALAALIAFCVVLASYRVYKMMNAKRYQYFTISFMLLTLSFLSRALTDTIVEGIFLQITKEQIGKVFFAGYVTHILLALIAYTILFFITHKITDKKVMALIYLILVPSILLSGSYFLSFYGLSAIFLSFIATAYYKNYKKICTGASCLVFIAFVLLALSQVQFLLDAFADYWYVGAHITQAAGYITLLIALIKTLRK